MASKSIPVLFTNKKGLKISIDRKDKKFFISPGLIIVNDKYIFFEGGDGELLDPPCLLGIKVKGTFSKIKTQKIEIEDNCEEGEEPLEQKCEEYKVTYLSKSESSVEAEASCQEMVAGETPVDDSFFKPLAIFIEQLFTQFNYGPLIFQAELFSNQIEPPNDESCYDGLIEFLL
jgi:hypothetical protein